MKYCRCLSVWIARKTQYSATDITIRKISCSRDSVAPGDEVKSGRISRTTAKADHRITPNSQANISIAHQVLPNPSRKSSNKRKAAAVAYTGARGHSRVITQRI